jgi:Uma2 family endonuclease
MPSIVLHAPVHIETAATAVPPRMRWTRAHCELLTSVGLDLNNYELVQGDLINQMGKNWPRVTGAMLLFKWIASVFGLLHVAQEAPIDVAPEDNPTNEPQPDLIVLKRPVPTYLTAKPTPADLHLVVEVAVTTLDFDRGTKAALYARAGIIEYWILDVSNRQLLVHRDPRNGQYASIAAYDETESVAPLAAPDRPFPVASAFGA